VAQRVLLNNVPEVLKKKKCRGLMLLAASDFSLAYYSPERFSAMLKQSNYKLCSLAVLVWSSRHLPGPLGSADFHSTFGTLSHMITSHNV
jgi:hypothetical protein